MKKDTVSVHSAVRTKNNPVHKSNGGKYSAKNTRNNSLVRLKTAVILIPVMIAIMIIAVLIIGVNQITYQSQVISNPSQHQSQQVSYYSDSESQKLLTVVSPKNPLPSGYMLNLTPYENIRIDRLVFDDLKRMMNDSEKANLRLNTVKGYVSTEEQNELFNSEVRRLMETEGYSRSRAEEEAELTVPMGNHAEQQSGLSVQFSSSENTDFARSDEYNWLIKNSYKYGFILRYPENKQEYTDNPFTPDLFRYVGVENALKIRTLNMCLDQYIIYLNAR